MSSIRLYHVRYNQLHHTTPHRHHTTLHDSILIYTTLYCCTLCYTATQDFKLQYNLIYQTYNNIPYITPHHITSHYIATQIMLFCTTPEAHNTILYYSLFALYYITPHCTVSHYTTLHNTTQSHTTLNMIRCNALLQPQHITLHYVIIHHIAVLHRTTYSIL